MNPMSKSRVVNVKFTAVEVAHLLCLLATNVLDGTYWGRRKDYEARTASMIRKLKHAIGEGHHEED